MLAAIAVLFVIGMSVLWIQVSHTYPEADQKAVSWVSYLMTQNNFLFFEHGKYMQIYPNQLGLTAILEVLYRLTGGENWKAFMYLTALANGVVVYLLYRITDRLYQDQNAERLVLLASMGCIQIILYSTFLYGMMLGLAFALGAFYALLLFLDHGKWRYAVSAGILIGISILVKNNYSIFLVALVILLLYDAVKKSGGTKRSRWNKRHTDKSLAAHPEIESGEEALRF
ncbi:MAG: glycosyltransferase family 39 protein [Eubacteriales bacterium]